ncbi:molybdate ABC transporter substrate-binding protein [Aliinostoc sp. HNIBRCY26]|uniref:molybdate ABC transporter substrate-binding protein n=1 Tax=Aliinostoc sp. HNIBRCY26 TaxID=3418997 RepID=UPI003CFDB91C
MVMSMQSSKSFLLFEENDRLSVRLYSALSLRPVISEIAQAFTRKYKIPIRLELDYADLLRERILGGEKADIFVTDDLHNPTALMQASKSSPVVNFVNNRICAIAKPGISVTSDTLLDAMLDPKIRLGISAPKPNLIEDYAQTVFHQAEKFRLGSSETLNNKALHLIGGSNYPVMSDKKNRFAYFILETQQVDIFLSYYTDARLAHLAAPSLQIIELSENLAVHVNYGMTIINNSHSAAVTLAMYILSLDGQSILSKYGLNTSVIG